MNIPVSIGGRAVGLLTASQDRLAFDYDESWLSHADAFPISVRMPLSQQHWDASIAHPFFANLLPEGPSREMFCDRLGVAYDDDIRLLQALGGDTAGALTIGDWRDADHHNRLAIAHEELERFANGDPTFRADEVIRLSLAGAQHKISAIQDNGLWWPGSQDASTHILKCDSPRFANLSVNEFFMRCLAEHLDLPVAAARLDVTTSKPFLVVERYDRRVIDGRVERLHQEDFCQALALSHHHKYEGAVGPTLAAIAQTIREHSYRPARDIQSLLRWAMFNVLAGNADGHAKNLSLLRAETGLQLAPFYDLVCTRAYRHLDRLMAFSMAGSRDSDTYGVMHWKGLATSLGVAPRVVLAELKRMHREYEDGIAFATQETRVFVADPNVLDPLISEVAKRFRTALNVLNAKGW